MVVKRLQTGLLFDNQMLFCPASYFPKHVGFPLKACRVLHLHLGKLHRHGVAQFEEIQSSMVVMSLIFIWKLQIQSPFKLNNTNKIIFSWTVTIRDNKSSSTKWTFWSSFIKCWPVSHKEQHVFYMAIIWYILSSVWIRPGHSVASNVFCHRGASVQTSRRKLKKSSGWVRDTCVVR